jgi:hypothetical protein
MFLAAFGRHPDDAELLRWTTATDQLAALRGVQRDQVMRDLEVWTEVAHAMFNAKEFIYLR